MIRVNLLPEKKQIKIPWGLVIEIALLGAMMYGVYWFLYLKEDEMGFATTQQFEPMLEEINAKIDQMNKEINDLKKSSRAQLEGQQQQYEVKRREKEQLKRLTGLGILPWSTIFEEFTRLINENDVWISSWDTQGTRVSIRGKGLNDMKSVSKFMRDLEEKSKDRMFYNVILQSSSKDKMFGKPIVNFQITFDIRKNTGMEEE